MPHGATYMTFKGGILKGAYMGLSGFNLYRKRQIEAEAKAKAEAEKAEKEEKDKTAFAEKNGIDRNLLDLTIEELIKLADKYSIKYNEKKGHLWLCKAIMHEENKLSQLDQEQASTI